MAITVDIDGEVNVTGTYGNKLRLSIDTGQTSVVVLMDALFGELSLAQQREFLANLQGDHPEPFEQFDPTFEEPGEIR